MIRSSFTAIPYKEFRGLKIPTSANEEFFHSAVSYEPKEGDIFLVSYPKCGTTWTQHIIYLIFNEGRPARNHSEVVASVPFPEQDGFPEGKKPLALKYHLPFELTPFSENAKYVFVTRNPLDTCVSYYHFLKNLPSYDIQSFDLFFEAFLQGDLPYGDYFHHVSSWYKNRHRKNVLYITYERLKSNHKESVRRIATFLGQDDVARNDTILNDIVHYSSLDFMRALVDGGTFMTKYLRFTSTERKPGDSVESSSFLKASSEVKEIKEHDEPRMIRKGHVGDWKNYVSPAQEEKMKHALVQRTDGIDTENIFQDAIRDFYPDAQISFEQFDQLKTHTKY